MEALGLGPIFNTHFTDNEIEMPGYQVSRWQGWDVNVGYGGSEFRLLNAT